ncbi:MAG: CPBP family intramembrane metalloprotease [Oscillospiraceae bacterium]|nr:CPBP family intramembrane metalloprotease [Oscillospiraceae bacterium]
MYRLLCKNELTFAIILIVLYVVGSSLMQQVSASLGIDYLAETVFVVALAAVLAVFVLRRGLARHVGLCPPALPAARMLFYLPLWLIAGGCLVFGAGTVLSPRSVLLHTVMMMAVGFLEELIFRGFLFRGIAAKGSRTRAVVIASLTFGIGHIVNLFNGYALLDSLTQIVFAVSVGFLLTMLFVRTGSLWACIVFHILNNVLTVFETGEVLEHLTGSSTAASLTALGVRLCLTLGYLLYVCKALPPRELTDGEIPV